MDSQRFDDLTRALAGGVSRRRILKGLAAGLLGGVTGAAGGRTASAATPCTSGRQCPSYRCVDGYCCDRSCSGQCEACNVAGLEGICSPVTGAPVGNRSACPGTGSCQATCDGQHPNGCIFPGGETNCGSSTCANGWQTTYACGGNGTCTPTTTSCGLFVCNPAGTACLTSCASNGDCVGAAFCNAQGVCQGDRPLGEPCTSADQCQHGHCVDGVCCVERCEACEACNLPGNAGFCGPVADGAPCAGGACCDGTCVDTRSDVRNCGACDNDCPPGVCQAAVCVEGVCDTVPHSFFEGRDCDDGDPCTTGDVCRNGACVGTPLDCSDLDDQCTVGVCNPTTAQCEARPAADGTPCDDGRTCCGSACVDTQTDADNCGECGTACAAGERCFDGECVECRGLGDACAAFGECCDGLECDLQVEECRLVDGGACTDDDQCSSFGRRCCDGACTSLVTEEHCGGCGIRCGPTEECVLGEDGEVCIPRTFCEDVCELNSECPACPEGFCNEHGICSS